MLCTAILGSDFTILFGIAGVQCSICCKVVAILLHWFGLSTHFWTFLILFDLNRSASTVFELQRLSSRNYLIYNIFAWGITFLIVMTCVALDEASESMVKYGENGICWIGSHIAHLAAYLAPVAFLMLVSVILVVRFAIVLKRRLTDTKSSLECIHKSRLKMYHELMYKIVLLFGISEVVGFVQVGEGNEIRKLVSLIFRFLYNVIRSMRGLFVFLSLVVFCRRARNGLINIFKRPMKQPTDMTTSVTQRHVDLKDFKDLAVD